MNKKFMLMAIEQARLAAKAGEVPVGAVVEKNGIVLSAAHNLCEQKNDPTAHAELLAIKAACKKEGNFRLKGASLYVTLEPCPMCAGAAENARLGEIVFGAYDPVKGVLGSVCNLYSYPLPNRPQVFGGICENECKELLRSFFSLARIKSSQTPEF